MGNLCGLCVFVVKHKGTKATKVTHCVYIPLCLSAPLQLVFDDLPDLVIRLVSREHAAVDEYGRRAGNPSLRTVSRVLLDGLRRPARIEAGIKGGSIEFHRLGSSFQIIDGELLLIPEHRIVKFPEAPLPVCAHGGFCRLLRTRMDIRQREMPIHEADSIRVVSLHQLECRKQTATEGTLKIRDRKST